MSLPNDISVAASAAATAAASTAARRVVFYTIIGALCMTTLGFAVAAAWMALTALYSGPVSALIVAGGCLALVIIALLIDLTAHQRRMVAKTRTASRPHNPAASTQSIAPLLAQTFVAAVHVGRSARR